MSNLITPGEPAPDFELDDLNDRRVRLAGFKGNKIIVLYFLRGFM